jgi:hypothetical protein
MSAIANFSNSALLLLQQTILYQHMKLQQHRQIGSLVKSGKVNMKVVQLLMKAKKHMT